MKEVLNEMATAVILSNIETERRKQLEKWGKQRHDLPYWLAILVEEVGEVSKAICEGAAYDPQYASTTALVEAREELIQTAAVSVAIVEHIDEILENRKIRT